MFQLFILSTIFLTQVNARTIRHRDIQPKAYQMNEINFTDKTPSENLQSAFQKNYFLHLDDQLTEDHLYAIKIPRCGLSRITLTSEVKWSKFDLSWCLETPSQEMPVCEQRETLELAFRIWSRSTDFRFTEVPCNEAEILFFFNLEFPGNEYHSDGQGGHQVYIDMTNTNEDELKGVGIYFDEAENWRTDDTQEASILFAAAHAIGHTLGLGHSSDPRSVMIYTFYYPVSELSSDDKMALQKLYGQSVMAGRESPRMATIVQTNQTTKQNAFLRTQTAILESTQNPLNESLRPETYIKSIVDYIQTGRTTLFEKVLRNKTRGTNQDVAHHIIHRDSKIVPGVRMNQHLNTIIIQNTNISQNPLNESSEPDNGTKSKFDYNQTGIISLFRFILKNKTRGDNQATTQIIYPDSKILPTEQMDYNLNNVHIQTENTLNESLRPETETTSTFDYINIRRTSLIGFVLQHKTSGNNTDVTQTIHPDTKMVPPEQVGQYSNAVIISNTDISQDEYNNPQNESINVFPQNDRGTNGLLNKDLIRKEPEPSLLRPSKERQESQNEERDINYSQASVNRHITLKPVVTKDMDAIANTITPLSVGDFPTDYKYLAGIKNKLSTNLQNEMNAGLTLRKTSKILAGSLRKNLVENIKERKGQEKQQKLDPRIKTLGRYQNKSIYRRIGGGTMSKEHGAEVLPPESDTKRRFLASTITARKSSRSKETEAGFRFKEIKETNKEDQKEDTLFLESEIVNKSPNDEESNTKSFFKAKPPVTINITTGKEEPTLQPMKVSIYPKESQHVSRKLQTRRNPVLKHLRKIVSLKDRTHTKELKKDTQMKKQLLGNDSEVFVIVHLDTITPVITLPLGGDDETYTPNVNRDVTSTRRYDIKPLLIRVQINDSNSKELADSPSSNILATHLSGIKPRKFSRVQRNCSHFTELADSPIPSNTLATKLSTLKHPRFSRVQRNCSYSQELTNSPRPSNMLATQLSTFKHRRFSRVQRNYSHPKELADSLKLFHILPTQLTLKENTLKLICPTSRTLFTHGKLRLNSKNLILVNSINITLNATVTLSSDLTQLLNPNFHDKDNTSTVEILHDDPTKQQCRCDSKISNCEWIFCWFLRKVLEVSCQFYQCICSVFYRHLHNQF